MARQFIRLEVSERVAVATMDRPPVNAQSRDFRNELISVFDELSDRDDVHAVILTASGQLFSAGADIKERSAFLEELGEYVRHNRITREFFYAVTDCTKPVIAAANGPAIGAGFVLMLAADIVLATEDAWVQMPELDVGLAGGAGFLMEHFGRSMARYMYFTGRRVPASDLVRLGVITACFPRARLMDEARAIAQDIAAKSPIAVRWVKRAFNVVESMPVRDAYRFEQTVTVDLSRTKDAKEAQQAFVEKRKPNFTGR